MGSRNRLSFFKISLVIYAVVNGFSKKGIEAPAPNNNNFITIGYLRE